MTPDHWPFSMFVLDYAECDKIPYPYEPKFLNMHLHQNFVESKSFFCIFSFQFKR